MNLKEQLLNPVVSKPVSVQMFNREFLVKKMSTARLMDIEKKMEQLGKGSSPEGVNHFTAEVILEAMVDEDGASMTKDISPDELLELYDPKSISDALNAVYTANYVSAAGEEAAKKD